MRIIIKLASLEQYDDLNDEEHLEKVERYVILMYDRTSDLYSVNESRRHLFTKKNRSSENLPLTLDALEQHLKRAIKEGESRRMFSFLIPKPRLSVRLGMHYPSNY